MWKDNTFYILIKWNIKENLLVQLKTKTKEKAWRKITISSQSHREVGKFENKAIESWIWVYLIISRKNRRIRFKSKMIFLERYRDKLFLFLLRNKTDRDVEIVKFDRECTIQELSVILRLWFWSRLVIKVNYNWF